MTLPQRKADEAAQAEYATAAALLRKTADGIFTVSECIVLDPALGVYADEVRTLKVRAYVALGMKLLDLANEAEEKAGSYDAHVESA